MPFEFCFSSPMLGFEVVWQSDRSLGLVATEVVETIYAEELEDARDVDSGEADRARGTLWVNIGCRWHPRKCYMPCCSYTIEKRWPSSSAQSTFSPYIQPCQ